MLPGLPSYLQAMQRLGLKQWPYRKRTTAANIEAGLEVKAVLQPCICLPCWPDLLCSLKLMQNSFEGHCGGHKPATAVMEQGCK